MSFLGNKIFQNTLNTGVLTSINEITYPNILTVNEDGVSISTLIVTGATSVGGNLTVTGNLEVKGDSVLATDTYTTDSSLLIGADNKTLDIGVNFQYDTSPLYGQMYYDLSENTFRFSNANASETFAFTTPATLELGQANLNTIKALSPSIIVSDSGGSNIMTLGTSITTYKNILPNGSVNLGNSSNIFNAIQATTHYFTSLYPVSGSANLEIGGQNSRNQTLTIKNYNSSNALKNAIELQALTDTITYYSDIHSFTTAAGVNMWYMTGGQILSYMDILPDSVGARDIGTLGSPWKNSYWGNSAASYMSLGYNGTYTGLIPNTDDAFQLGYNTSRFKAFLSSIDTSGVNSVKTSNYNFYTLAGNGTGLTDFVLNCTTTANNVAGLRMQVYNPSNTQEVSSSIFFDQQGTTNNYGYRIYYKSGGGNDDVFNGTTFSDTNFDYPQSLLFIAHNGSATGDIALELNTGGAVIIHENLLTATADFCRIGSDGTTIRPFKEGYFGASATDYVVINNTGLIPYADDTYAIGSETSRFNGYFTTLYADTCISSDSVNKDLNFRSDMHTFKTYGGSFDILTLNTTNIITYTNILPNVVNSRNLGSSTYPFKEGYFGASSTDYTKIDDAGITLVGPARRYKCLTVPILNFKRGSTAPTEGSIDDKFSYYEYGINDFAYNSLVIPQDADLSADIGIYVGWFIDEAYATESGEIQFQVIIRAVADGEVIDSGGYTQTYSSGDINIPATAKTYKQSLIGTIAGGSISAYDEIGGQLKRIAIDDGDDPTANPRAVCVALKYRVKQLGESS